MSRSNLRYQYQQIAKAIEDQILRGELRVGERLPSERFLSQRFEVQRNTIRQALTSLERDQHIETRGRLGSYVMPPAHAEVKGTILVNIDQNAGSNGAALFEGILHGAESVGLSVARTDTEPLPNSWLNRVPDPAVLANDTAGIILWPHHPSESEKLKKLNESLPVVLVDHRVTGVEIDCVRFDDVNGGKVVTEHLLKLGHRKIAFLTDEVFVDSVQARWCGYILAHEYAGLTCDSRLSLLYQFIEPKILSLTLKYLLSDPETRPTAVICSNDLVALKLLSVLNAEGLRVPKDVAVTGYGNSTPEYTSAISLTSVDQPFYQMRVGGIARIGREDSPKQRRQAYLAPRHLPPGKPRVAWVGLTRRVAKKSGLLWESNSTLQRSIERRPLLSAARTRHRCWTRRRAACPRSCALGTGSRHSAANRRRRRRIGSAAAATYDSNCAEDNRHNLNRAFRSHWRP